MTEANVPKHCKEKSIICTEKKTHLNLHLAASKGLVHTELLRPVQQGIHELIPSESERDGRRGLFFHIHTRRVCAWIYTADTGGPDLRHMSVYIRLPAIHHVLVWEKQEIIQSFSGGRRV